MVNFILVFKFIKKIKFIILRGYNENGLVSDDLSYIKMPVVTHETCIWSNRDFFSKVTSEKSFCAGFRNGTNVCNGDSGGGKLFLENAKIYF
jgi:dynein heavy chain